MFPTPEEILFDIRTGTEEIDSWIVANIPFDKWGGRSMRIIGVSEDVCQTSLVDQAAVRLLEFGWSLTKDLYFGHHYLVLDKIPKKPTNRWVRAWKVLTEQE